MSSDQQPASHRPTAPAKPKVAADYSGGKDLTAIQENSRFELCLRELIKQVRPRFVVETGTYLGQGTTRMIGSALKEFGLGSTLFYSIECNPDHHRQAVANLSQSGLALFVRPLQGLSVPRRQLPTPEMIRRQTIDEAGGSDLFVDHREEQRVDLYFRETDFPNLPDDLLGACLRECGGQPDLVLLDSGGHLGNVEFNHLLSLLRGPCYLVLDDVHHVKHARSLRQMKADARFEILCEVDEKFGACFARFTPAAAQDASDVHRILWVRSDSIGDAVLASSMLPRLRHRYPAAQLAVLCQEHLSGLYTNCPAVNQVICFDKGQFISDAGYKQSILAEIAQFAPDLVLNSTYSRDSLSEELTHSVPARAVVGIEGDCANQPESESRQWASRYTRLLPSPGARKLELERHQDFLLGLGLGAGRLQPAVWTSAADEALAEAFFKETGLDPQRTLALCPGAQDDFRIYQELGAALSSLHDYHFLVFGGPESVALGEELARRLRGATFNLAGRTTLTEMAALLRRCRLYVGGETAGAHLACAVGIPNVVVTGGGHFGRFFPYSPLTTLVCLPLDCYSCNWTCKHSSAHCVSSIAPEVVTEAVKAALKGNGARPRLFFQVAHESLSALHQQLAPVAAAMDLQALDIRPVSVAQATPAVWSCLQYGSGVHKKEGDFRWLDADALLRVTVPSSGCPARLTFDLQAAELAWYPQPPLRVEVRLNDQLIHQFAFQTGRQTEQVCLFLQPASAPYRIRITSNQAFGGGPGDSRRLSVQLRRVSLKAELNRASRSPESPQPAAGEGRAEARPSVLSPLQPACAAHAKGSAEPAMPPQTALQFVQLADGQFARGDLKACSASLQRAVELEPANSRFLASLGSVHFQLGEHREARRCFEQAVKLDPKNPTLLVQLGAACLQLQDGPAFEAAFQRALTINPDCPEALHIMANLNLQVGELPQAVKLYQKLSELSPNDTGVLLALAKCRFQLGNAALARSLYERVLQLEPANATAQEALQHIGKKLRLQPRSPNEARAPRYC